MSNEPTNWKVKPEEYPDFDPVVEVWESFSGSLWFITEVDGNQSFGYARLSQSPQFAEWGYIERNELDENPKVWKVPKSDWSNVNTYEDGLLEQVE